MTPTKYKVCTWFDTKTREPFWGVQVRIKEDNNWYHVQDDGKPLFFTKEADAKKRVKLLNDDLKQ